MNPNNDNDTSLILDLENKSAITNKFNVEKFNVEKFVNDLEKNVKKLSELHDKGLLGIKISDITGETTRIMIQSLDLNNQFIQLSLFINHHIKITTDQIKENQELLEKSQKEIKENHEQIDITDGKLEEAVEKFNQMSDKLDTAHEEINKLNETKNIINTQFNTLKNSIGDQVQKFSSSSNDFIRNSQSRLDTIAHEIGSLSDETKNNINSYSADLNKINSQLDQHIKFIDSKYKWMKIILIITVILSLSSLLVNLLS